ncbi:MAG: hypothetical protein MUC36_09635 [Planctomycetes bacterium]|jgi:hypothetical protein|nr:hypothetical protein [Planctomycetota bacterium]
MTRSVSSVSFALAAMVALPAQGPESRGLLAGAPVAVLVRSATDDAQVRVRRNGFQLLATPPLPPSPLAPDLRQILVLHNAPPDLEVDDLSLGRDEVLVNASGFITVPPNSWGVLSFSLKQGATGVPGSRIAVEAAAGSVGAALFSWVLPSNVLPPQVIGRVERSHSRQEFGLPPGSDIDGIDIPLMLGRDQGNLLGREPGFAALIAAPERIYFTVSHAARFGVPDLWWGPGPLAALRSGATIFVTERTSPTAPWLRPRVFQHYYELGLLQHEDIDGLAYDEVADKLLFSCVRSTTAPIRDEFLFLDMITDGPVVPEPVKTMVPTPQGPVPVPVSQQIGKGQNDDVDGICALDPQILTNNLPPPAGDDFGSSGGAPRPGLLGVPTVQASAFRRFQGGQVFFDSIMLGWPPLTGPAPGFAALFVTIGNDPTLLPAGPILLRNPTPAVPGDPQQYSLLVPPPFPLSNTVLTFRWVALDFATAELAEAWPVQVYL